MEDSINRKSDINLADHAKTTPVIDDMSFRVNLQYLKTLSFNSPSAPIIFSGKQDAPDIKVNVDVLVDKLAEDAYEVALGIVINASSDSDKMKHYNFSMQYAAIAVSTEKHSDDYGLKYYLMVTVPLMLQPFARHIVSRTIGEAAFAAILLEPINFHKLFMDKVKSGELEVKK